MACNQPSPERGPNTPSDGVLDFRRPFKGPIPREPQPARRQAYGVALAGDPANHASWDPWRLPSAETVCGKPLGKAFEQHRPTHEAPTCVKCLRGLRGDRPSDYVAALAEIEATLEWCESEARRVGAGELARKIALAVGEAEALIGAEGV